MLFLILTKTEKILFAHQLFHLQYFSLTFFPLNDNYLQVANMESINLRIENWESHEVEEISYSVSIKVPPKDELLRLLPGHLSNLQYPWQCHTGVLAKCEHSIKVCLYREYHEPKVGVYAAITNSPESGRITELRGIDVTYLSQGEQGITIDDAMSKVDPPKPMEIPGMEFWSSTCGWPEHASIVFLLLHVVKRKPPRIVNDETNQEKTPQFYDGTIDIKQYFLSEECSDVTIFCGKAEFPAHLIVLCGRSSYFRTMFSSSMKETKERKVHIEDMSADGVKELLRFIYHGADPQKHTKELFSAADKYGMEDLRTFCERHLVQILSADNAIEIFELAQLHGSAVLTRKAKEVILWNKSKLFPDAQSLKEFTQKYPDLVYNLLQFENI